MTSFIVKKIIDSTEFNLKEVPKVKYTYNLEDKGTEIKLIIKTSLDLNLKVGDITELNINGGDF